MPPSPLARVLALAAGKASKDEADYRPATDPAKSCATCTMSTFKGHDLTGTCSAVEGPVDRRDLCDYFKLRTNLKASLLDAGQVIRLGSGFVEPYEREEKGHLEKVAGYAEHKHPKVVGPVLEGTHIPASKGIYVARTEDGDYVEVQKSRLWLHASEGKPGPLHGEIAAGTMVTWPFHGKILAGKIVGPHGTGIPADAKLHPTQGTFIDGQGGRHWGWYGGAGLLLHHTDEAGVQRYLLQRRAFGIHAGGTWSTPGGAIDKPGGIVETPARAAFREAEEEGWGNVLKPATVTGVQAQHFGGQPGEPGTWTYHTVSASVPEMEKPSGKGSHAGEATGAKWVTPAEMADMPLHPDFRATAEALGMPKGGGTKAPALPTYKQTGRHPLVRDDYKAGRRVTWVYKGKPMEGIVQGPAGPPPGKNKLPEAYNVQMGNGEAVAVKWGQLRLHPSENPEDAKKAEKWEQQQHTVISGGHGKSTQPKLGYGSPKAPGGEVLKAHSLRLPGLTHTVPAKVQGKPVETVYEHSGGKNNDLLLRVQGGEHVLVKGKKLFPVSKIPAAKAPEDYGWKSLPVSPPQSEQGGSSPLGKVVAAEEKWSAGDWHKAANDPDYLK